MPTISYSPLPVKPSSSVKATYRIKNWPAYDRSLVQRGDVTVWLDESALSGWSYAGPAQRGAQYVYSDLAIETALTLKGIFHLGLRQTEGFVGSLLRLMGTDLSAPDHTTLSRRQGNLPVDLQPRVGTEPLHIAIDSTGLKVYGEGEWKVRQHGWQVRRTWRRLHLGVDEASGQITAMTLTDRDIDDASQMPVLVEDTPAAIQEISADGAYDRTKVFTYLAHPKDRPPIRPIIPPRKNAKIQRHGNRKGPRLERDEILRYIRRKGRKQWKKNSRYHRRSQSETQMYRYKKILGPKLSARKIARQQTEARIGCAILNRMFHLGRPQTYKLKEE
jgi:hypothetical protein